MPDEAQAEQSDQLGPILEFMKLLWAVDHALQSSSKRMEATFGITGPQQLVVRIVGRFPGNSPGARADGRLLPPSARAAALRPLGQPAALPRPLRPLDRRRALP